MKRWDPNPIKTVAIGMGKLPGLEMVVLGSELLDESTVIFHVFLFEILDLGPTRTV